MQFNQLLALVLIPIIAAAVASAVQCKIQGETEIGRCALGGFLAGVVAVIFYFIGLMIAGGN